MRNTPTAGIILAAGESSRFGQPKQLLELRGRMLVAWVLDAALASRLESVFLVLGRDHLEIGDALGQRVGHPKLEILFNPRYHEGQSTSLTAGLFSIRDRFPAVMFLLGDQPLVDAATINRLLEKFRHSGKTICVPVHRGQRGNPALFSRSHYEELARLSGDKGARDIIAARPDQVLEVPVADPALFLDIDTPADVESVSRLLSQTPIRDPR
ncbi:MAG TPA: nucleotidyltransferase family protein [Desulfobacterales bacterium]|nr:nucleotidyltransferase family protein [Desulfobacterales bacterium]